MQTMASIMISVGLFIAAISAFSGKWDAANTLIAFAIFWLLIYYHEKPEED